MYITHLFPVVLLILLQYSILVTTQCPSNFLIEPCLCIPNNSSYNRMVLYSTLEEMISLREKSIVCEHINTSSFDLRSIFIKLSTELRTTNQTLLFNDFLLYDTQIHHLPANLFGNLTFSDIKLYDNPLLSSIDIDTFDSTRNTIEAFQTLNSNLSETIFPILQQFHHLRFLIMNNDSIQSLPDYAFNHTELVHIGLGNHQKQTFQPLIHLGKYPFYHLPNLILLRIVSPLLTTIRKYSFAMNRRLGSNANDPNSMLYIEMSGSKINGSSFEPTSLTRFRNQPVFLRLFYTSIDYFDEQIFQPFLETHPSSLLGIDYSNISQTCDDRSAWIRDEYCRINGVGNRVYGTACCHF